MVGVFLCDPLKMLTFPNFERLSLTDFAGAMWAGQGEANIDKNHISTIKVETTLKLVAVLKQSGWT